MANHNPWSLDMNHHHLLFHASVQDAPSPSFPPSTPQPNHSNAAVDHEEEEEDEALGAMKEMMYRIAAMQPVDIDPATVKKPRRRNVRISEDPQSVAARHRRERISERIRILQRLVPGGTKMDTASMLHEAIRYIKFLKRQLHHLQPPVASAFAGPTVSVIGGLQPTATGRATGPFVDWAAVRPTGIGRSTSPPSSSSSMGPHAGQGFGFGHGHGMR